MSPALRVECLWKCYAAGVRGCSARAWVLRGLTLCLDPGERVAIVGGAGSGKSTLAACLLGLRSADVGLIEVAGAIRVLDGARLGARGEHGSPATIVLAPGLGLLRGWSDRVLLLRDGRLHATAVQRTLRVAEHEAYPLTSDVALR